MEKIKQYKYIILSVFVTIGIVAFFVYGSEDPKKINDEVNPIVEKVGNNDFETYESRLGFSFQYPPQYFVMEDPETSISERLYVLIKDDEDTSGIIISTIENTEDLTPLEWLEGPNSGADLSRGYDVLDIDGQEAISLDSGMWIVVDTPDNKYQLSIATLSTSSKNGELLYTGLNTILSSFEFFK